MNSLKARLHLAEEDFLVALAKGGDALSAFDERWETLINDIDNTTELSGLDAETATLAHTIAYRISVLADTCADLAKTYDTFTSQLMDEITVLMADLVVVDSTGVDLSTSTPHSKAPFVSSSSCSSVSDHRSTSTRKRSREDGIPLSSEGYQRTKRQRSIPSVRDPTPLSRNSSPSSPSVSSTTPSPSTDSPPQAEHRPNRKRRLSDADLVVSCHKAKRVHVGPRLHAVSDSFTTFRPSTSLSKQSGRVAPVLPPLLPSISSPLVIQPLITSSLNEEAMFFNPDEEFGLTALPDLTNMNVFCSPAHLIPVHPGTSADSAVDPADAAEPSSALDWPECVFAASPALSSDSSSSPSPTASCPATPPLCPDIDFSLHPYSLGFPLSEVSSKSKDILVPINLIPGETLPHSLDALQSNLTLDPFFDPLDPSVWLSASYSHWPEMEDALPQTKTSCHATAAAGLQLDAVES